MLGEGAGEATVDQVGGEDAEVPDGTDEQGVPDEPAEPADPPTVGTADEAAQEMREAYAKLREARSEGDFRKEAEAFEELEAAWQAFNDASEG